MVAEKRNAKRRRVSFQIPEKEKAPEDNEPPIKVSVTEDETADDREVEKLETSNEEGEKELQREVLERGSEGGDSAEDSGSQQSADDDTEESDGSEREESEGDASELRGDERSEGDGGVASKKADGKEEQNDASKAPSPILSFGEMVLDSRVERAVERMGWNKPTPVQSAVIPAALAARDVLVSAPTGSGKTGAYVVPIVQNLCRPVEGRTGPRAVVLVPTRELVHQVATVFKSLCKYIEGVKILPLLKKKRKNVDKSGPVKDAEAVYIPKNADIVVATPSSFSAATNTDSKALLSSVDFVVVDEADLVLSYGYMKDAQTALGRIPVNAQAMLLSATLEDKGMASFKRIVLRRPLTIKVTTDEPTDEGDPSGASHYTARLKNHRDRYLVAYVMLRLNVVCGKVLIFTNHINAAFRLKLFLDQFKIKSAVLNSELPANSRMHCVQQFNAGVFDILIATDESKNDRNQTNKRKGRDGPKQHETKKRKHVQKDEEFGLSRGVDFRDVAAVFNFDVPETSISYTHRAGRTARAGKSGTVLTLVCCDQEEKALLEMGRDIGVHIGPLAFRMDQIEAFRYRVEDCMRMLTDSAVSKARLVDIRREIVNSEQLQEYFEDNPRDLDALQHNLSLANNIPEHLAHIPSYLLPAALRESVSSDPKGTKYRKKAKRRSKRVVGVKNGGDPLKTFTTKGVAGSSRQRFQERHGIVKKAKRSPGQMLKKKRKWSH